MNSMDYLLMDEKEFKKIVKKSTIYSVYGTDSIEYTIEGSDVYIVKAGSKLQTNREKPYEVILRRKCERFKTLKEALSYAQDLCWKDCSMKEKEII
jgi:hypothetical protein